MRQVANQAATYTPLIRPGRPENGRLARGRRELEREVVGGVVNGEGLCMQDIRSQRVSKVEAVLAESCCIDSIEITLIEIKLHRLMACYCGF